MDRWTKAVLYQGMQSGFKFSSFQVLFNGFFSLIVELMTER